MRLVFYLFWMCFSIFGVQAQPSESVLVISYAPSLHFSDCDPMLAEYNHCSKAEWRAIFQTQLEKKLLDALSNDYTVISVYLSPQEEDQALFKDWHKKKYCTYTLDTPTRLENTKQLESNMVKVLNWVKKTSSSLTEKDNLCLKQNMEETKYLKAIPQRKEALDSVATLFNVSKILLLTQIEIKTNYTACIATDGTKFDRAVKLHFVFYDKNAQLLTGDVAVSKGQSNTNDKETFFEEHLGYLSFYVTSIIKKN